jgi:hypothetical protein
MWKKFVGEMVIRVNELLPVKMSFGRLARKIIYFQVYLMSWTLYDWFVYFVVPEDLQVFLGDLNFEQNIDRKTLKLIAEMYVKTIKDYRREIQSFRHTESVGPQKLSEGEYGLMSGGTLLHKFSVTKGQLRLLEKQYTGSPGQFRGVMTALLLRYEMFGRNKEGIVLSANKVYENAKKVFHEDKILECFAGAINWNLPHYCSLFYDIEKRYFGSLGSFFLLTSEQRNEYDVLICNPPYITQIMNDMSNVLNEYLDDKTGNAYCYVIIPDWRTQAEVDIYPTETTTAPTDYERSLVNYDAYRILRESKYHMRTEVIPDMKYAGFYSGERGIRSNTLIITLSNSEDAPLLT